MYVFPFHLSLNINHNCFFANYATSQFPRGAPIFSVRLFCETKNRARKPHGEALFLTHNSMIDYIFQEFLTAKSKKSKKFLLEDRVLFTLLYPGNL
jgi:hypothetical protein